MAENVGSIEYFAAIELEEFVRNQRELDKRIADIERRGSDFGGAMSAMAKAVAGAIAAISVANLVNELVAVQRQTDVMTASLKTLTGSQEGAAKSFEMLKEFAASTPYDLEQVVGAFTKLKSMGLDPSQAALTSYGNTASAMGKSLNQMVEAVADAATGEFERLKEFGIRARQEGDKVTFTFQGVSTTVGKSAGEITQYLQSIGDVNFAGAMADRMATLDGAISNLEDSYRDLFRAVNESGIGELIAKSVAVGTKAVSEAAQSLRQGGLTEYFEGVKPLIVAAELAVVSLAGAMTGRLVAAMIATVTQAYATATALGGATVAARGFSAAMALMGGPVSAVITLLGGLVTYWIAVGDKAKSAADISEDSARRIKQALARATDDAKKAELSSVLSDQMADLRKAEKDAQASSGMYGTQRDPKFIEAAQQRVEALRKAVADTKNAMADVDNASLRDNYKSRRPDGPTGDTGAASGFLDKLKKDNMTALQLIKQREEESLAEAKRYYDTGAMTLAQYEDAKTQIVLRAESERKKAREKGAGKYDAQAELDQLRMANMQGLELINERERLALAAADKRRAAGQMSEQVHQQQITEIQRKAEADREKLRDDAMARGEELRRKIEEEGKARAEKQAQGQEMARSAIIGAMPPIEQIQARLDDELSRIGAAQQLDLENTQLYEDAKTALKQQAAVARGEIVQQEIDREQRMQDMALSSLSTLMGNISSAMEKAGKERTAIAKAAFLAQKAISVAQIIMNAELGASQALALGPVVGIPLANVIRTAGYASAAVVAGMAVGEVAGGRQYGGPVNAGSMYRVNETGRPEMFTASSGEQYMLPTKSGRVTSANKVGAGGGAPRVTIINNGTPQTVQSQSYDQTSNTVQLVMADLVDQFASGSGPVYGAMMAATNVRPRL